MDKVWCVFSGAYSDRYLKAVFSSKEKAQNYIDTMKKYNKGFDSLDDEPIDFILNENVEIKNVYYRYDLCLMENGKKEESLEVENINFSFNEDVIINPYLISDEECTHLIVRVNYNPDENVMKKSVYDKVAKYFAEKENI